MCVGQTETLFGEWTVQGSHVLVGLGWVDFDFCVPPSCPAAQPPLPNYHQLKQSRADSGILEIQVNKTQSTSTWRVIVVVRGIGEGNRFSFSFRWKFMRRRLVRTSLG